MTRDIEDMTDAQDEAPERIWLQEPVGLEHERSWCAEQQSDDDTPYIRADLARPSQAGDERMEALVAFARPFADALEIECDFMTPPAPFEDGFDVRSRARAALAAMDTPAQGGGDGWQPIETAPSDKDLLLGWRQTEWEGAGWSCAVDLAHSTRGKWRHGQATHWMFPPAPPAAMKDGGFSSTQGDEP